MTADPGSSLKIFNNLALDSNIPASFLSNVESYAAKSPTFMAELEAAGDAGYQIQVRSPSVGNYTDTTNKIIYIGVDPNATAPTYYIDETTGLSTPYTSATYFEGQLSHEVEHSVDSDYADKDPGTDASFANGMYGEAKADYNNVRVHDEMLANGGPNILVNLPNDANFDSSAYPGDPGEQTSEQLYNYVTNASVSTADKLAALAAAHSYSIASNSGENYIAVYGQNNPKLSNVLSGQEAVTRVEASSDSSGVVTLTLQTNDGKTLVLQGGVEHYSGIQGPSQPNIPLPQGAMLDGQTSNTEDIGNILSNGAEIYSETVVDGSGNTSRVLVVQTPDGGTIRFDENGASLVPAVLIDGSNNPSVAISGEASETLTLKNESDGMHYVLQTPTGTVDLTQSEAYAFDKASAVGGYIGGQLALLLAHHQSALAGLVTTTFFSTAGQLVGQEIDAQVLAGADLGTAVIANDFEQDAGGAIGGYAGAEAGSALFKGVGLNPALGQILGGTIGAAVGVYAANSLGKALGLTSASTSILNDVESSFAGAGIGIFEQITGLDPSKAFKDNPQNAEIGSSIGGLIGTALPIPVVGTVIGQFVGGIIGNLFGPGPSVGPNSSTPITVVNGAFALGPQGSDNNASQDLIATEAGFAQATVALLNAELIAIGGTVGGTTSLEFVRIFKDQFWDSTNSASAGSDFPNPTARSFSDYSSALNDAVVRQLQMTIIGGGDPVLAQAMRNSFASYDVNYLTNAQYGNTSAINPSNPNLVLPTIETLQQLNYDLQSVEDYNNFFQNKVAFLVGFAARYSANADQQAAADTAAGNTTAAAADVANAPAAALAAWNQEFFRGALLQRVWSFFSSSASESILDYSSTNTGHEGLLILDSSYVLANASISRSGDNLVITLSSTKAVTVTDAFTSNQYTLGEVEFTNLNGSTASTWNGADLQTLLLAGNASIKFSAITVVNGSTLSKTINGNGTYTIVNGNTDTITLNGQSGGIALNGTANKLTLSGAGNRISASGDQNVLSISGNSNTAVANGQGDTITLNGTSETLTVGGGSITLVNATTGTINGVSDTIALVNSDNLVVGGDSMTVTISGGGDTFKIGGNSETVTVTSAGSQDHVEADGQNDSLSIIGASNTITINGTSDALSVSGYGNTIAVNGASGNTITLSNYGNVVATAGTRITFQDSSGGTITGGGNIVSVGSSDNVELSGAGFGSTLLGNYSTVDYDGGYGSATISGSSNTLTVEGDKNVVTVGGSGNTVTVAGLGERLSVSGTGQSIAVNGGTVNVAAGAQVTFVSGNSGAYTNGSIINVGSGATVVVNGEGNSNNWVQASSSDTITLNGTGDGVGGSGSGNKVTFNGTNQYGYISSASLNLTSGSQVNLSGSSDTVTVAAGGTLSVIGDSNTITASGTGDSVTLSGSANHVSMTSGTLVLSGTDAPPGTGKVFSTDGFAFPSTYDGEYATAASANSLKALAATGANSVEFVVTQYVESVSDVNISTTTTVPGSGDVLTTESDANLEKAIAQAQAAGISVLVKPHVDIADGTWRAYLAPGANVATFFANYKAFIVHYAQIAQQTHVGMLSIGSELQSLTGAQYLSYWTDIIKAVRAVYSGKLTYGSAWSETSSVSFWSQLDVIGAHPYENPTQIANPTVAQLDAGWNSVSTDPTHAADFVDPISGKEVSPVTFYADLAAKYGKPILFTEIGYRSVNDATLLDGNYAGYSYEDFQQQTNALEAFFQTFSQYSATWLQGAYLWDWDPDPTDVVTQDFSVQGKPAQNVVDSWYGPTVTAKPQTANYLTGSSNTVTVQDGHALVLTGSSNTVGGGTGINVAVSGNSNKVTATAAGTGADTLVAVGNGNTLTGGAGNDILSGDGTGNILIGGGGSDTYQFSPGFGTETIQNGVSTANTAAGTLVLGAGLDPSKLWFVQSGNDLQIDVIGSTTDQITLKGWFSGAYAQIATLKFVDGSSITTAKITALITAMATYQAAHTTFNPQTATVMPTDTALQTALNADWARVITTNGTSIQVGEGGSTVVVKGTPTAINSNGSPSGLNYASVAGGVTVHLDTGTDSYGDTLSGFHTVVGSPGADTIYGTTGTDDLTGGTGNDVLIGNGGADTYRFSAGAGSDTIENGVSTTNTAAGRLILGAGQDPSKLWFVRSGNDLKIEFIGSSTDQVTLQNWFSGAYAQLATLQLADGSSITTAEIGGLVTAMATYQAAHTSFNPQTATAMPSDTALQAALNTGWARTFTTAGTAINVVEGSATVSVTGKVTAINGGAGATTLSYTGAAGVTVHLDTGTDSYGDTLTSVHSVTGTTDADTIYGSTGNDTLVGGVGNDTLIGDGGSDTYKFNAGYGLDTIENGVSTGTAASGTLVLGTGLTPTKLWFTQSGNDLKINVIGSTTDQVTIQGWFTGAYAQIASLQLADGSSIATAKISALVTAMAAYQAASTAFNPQTATVMPSDTTLQAALNTDWARTITTNGVAVQVGEGNAAVVVKGTATAINAGAGISNLNYASVAGGVTVHLDTGTDSYGDTLSGFHTVVGSPGADTIYGTTGNDDFTGGAGNDVLVGNGGSDIYRFSTGAGADIIENGVATTNTAAGTLVLGTGQDPSKLWFVQSGNDLKIEVIGSTTDQVTLQNWFSGAYAELSSLKLADGSSITTAEISGMVTAMATYQAAHTTFNPQTATVMPSDTTLQAALNTGWTRNFTTAGTAINVVEGSATVSVTGKVTAINGGTGATTLSYSGATGVTVHLDTGTDSYGDTLTNIHSVSGTTGADTIHGTTGADTLVGGAGNDTLIGGGGNDTYKFNAGYGSDTIENGISTGTAASGTLVLGTGLTPAKLWFTQSGNDLKIEVIGSTTDQVTIQGWFTGAYAQIASLQLADSSSIATAKISALVTAMATYQAANTAFNPQTATVMPTDTALQTALNADWARVITTNGTSIQVGEGGSTVVVKGTPTAINSNGSPSGLNYASVAGGVTVHLDTGTDSFGDTITGFHSVVGSPGADTIYGTTGNDDLTGGAGNDVLIGNGGSDIYRFTAGAGSDTIENGVSTTNTAAGQLVLGTGQDPSKLWFVQSGNDLKIEVIGSTTDQVTLQNWFSGAYAEIASLKLADGSAIATAKISALVTAMATYQAAHTTFNPQTATSMPTDAALQTALNTDWTRTITTNETAIAVGEGNATVSVTGKVTTINGGAGATTLSYTGTTGVTVHLDTGTDSYGDTLTGIHSVVGTSGADTIYGTSAADDLTGAAGNDVLIGNGGNDIYRFAAGAGVDTIENGIASANAAAGTLILGSTLAHTKLWFAQSGNDLQIDVIGSTTDQVIIRGWFTGAYAQLATLQAGDSYSISTAKIAQLTSAMSTYQSANSAFNPQTATAMPTDTTLQTAISADWSNGTTQSTMVQAQMLLKTDSTGDASSDAAPATPVTYTYADGDHDVSLTGADKVISFGTGTDSLTISSGGQAAVTGGDGNKTITLDDSSNTVTLGNGDNAITDSGDGGNNEFNLTAGTASLLIKGINDQVFLRDSSAVIHDQSTGLSVQISSAHSLVEIADWAPSQGLLIDLADGLGGYATTIDVLSALHDDGKGDAVLSLGSSGYLQFDHTKITDLSAATFHLSSH